MGVLSDVEGMCRAIDLRSVRLLQADRYYAGEQVLAYLSPLQRKALGDRLTSVSANYVRLATDSLAERLTVEGFTRAGESLETLWADWQANQMDQAHRVAILEALVTGQAYVTVWGDENGPVISVDSPREMAVTRHPLSRQVTSALKRWRDPDGSSRAVLYAPDTIRLFVGPHVPEGGALPTTGWASTGTLANPLGTTPVVALTNSGRLHDAEGTPEAAPIWSLVDALAKMLADILVASESTALPRRWATGLAVEEDDQGQPINPFSQTPGSVWQSEESETKFGSFPEPALSGYNGLIETLLRQIGSIAGLPDHLMGFSGTDPSSAEQIRAAESSLVARAYSAHVRFGPAFSRVAALAEAVRTGGRVSTDITTAWKSPESQTRAQEADAASKLVAAGIWPLERAWQELGSSPEEISELRSMNVRNALDRGDL